MTSSQYEMMEIGCLAFMAIYQLILYFQIKRRYYLYLSLICFSVLIRSLHIEDGSMLMYEIFPTLNPKIGEKIEFIAAYSNLILMPHFIYDIFKFYVFRRFVLIFQYVGFAWLLIIALTPHRIYFMLDKAFQLVLIAAFIMVFRIIYLAKRRRRTGAGYIGIGIALCFVFVVFEKLRISNVYDLNINGPNLINTGVVVFLVFLTIATSSIFAESFNENLQLTSTLNKRVEERTRELSESNIVKDHIIRTISHDLRSPLANLHSLLLLQSFESTDKLMNEHIQKIKNGINTSLDMLDDLLAWATSGRQGKNREIYFENVNLSNLAYDAFAGLQALAEQKKITVVNIIPDDLTVYSDPNILKVILRNLLNNALKFSHEKGQITLSSDQQEGLVTLNVADQGIGVPDKMKKTLFEMDPQNKRPGTAEEKSSGIGLAIVKDLVDQVGAQISVHDNEGEAGAIFTIKFMPKG